MGIELRSCALRCTHQNNVRMHLSGFKNDCARNILSRKHRDHVAFEINLHMIKGIKLFSGVRYACPGVDSTPRGSRRLPRHPYSCIDRNASDGYMESLSNLPQAHTSSKCNRSMALGNCLMPTQMPREKIHLLR